MNVPAIDLDRYLLRLGLAGDLAGGSAGGATGDFGPRLELLERLHLAHLSAIPFENLDVRLGRPLALDLASLEAKLVRRRRGGYCFEQNTLFAAALRACGFALDTLEARVRPPGAGAPLPRTHMLLRVRLPEGDRLADVGFGADGPLIPVPFDGRAVERGGDAHRVVREPDGTLVLRRRIDQAWVDLYAFGTTPALPVDFEVAHHYTATHPASVFRRTLTAQRSTETERYLLRGRSYTIRRGDELATREVGDREALELLRGIFGLDVGAEEVERALAAPETPAVATMPEPA